AAVAHRVDLARLALAVGERATQRPRLRAADRVARVPELERVGLVGNVAQHARLLAALDLPEHLAAELEVEPLVVDRPRTAAGDHDAVIGARDQIVDRALLRARRERD